MSYGVAKKDQHTNWMTMGSRILTNMCLIKEGTVEYNDILMSFSNAGANVDGLYSCEPMSVAKAVSKAVRLGLDISGDGEVYLIPYKGVCDITIGYQGLVRLLNETREIRRLVTDVVYEKDEFRVDNELSPPFKHSPHLVGDRGEVTHAYSWCQTDKGVDSFCWMTIDQLLAVKAKSKSLKSSSSPWHTFPDEMFKKVAFRRMVKWAKSLVKGNKIMQEAINVDNKSYDFQKTQRAQSASTLMDRVAHIPEIELTEPPAPPLEPEIEPEPQSKPSAPKIREANPGEPWDEMARQHAEDEKWKGENK